MDNERIPPAVMIGTGEGLFTEAEAEELASRIAVARGVEALREELERELFEAMRPFIGREVTETTKRQIADVLIREVKARDPRQPQQAKPKPRTIRARPWAGRPRTHTPEPNPEAQRAAEERRAKKAAKLEALAARGGIVKA